MDEKHQVRDKDQFLSFEGRLLGNASSGHPKKARWTEVEIYRTTSGRYVVATIGRSTAPDEETYYQANVSETARGAVEALHQVDADDIRYLTKTARQALDAACSADPELREAYQLQVID